MYKYVYIYMHIYIHTHIYIYIYTYVYMWPGGRRAGGGAAGGRVAMPARTRGRNPSMKVMQIADKEIGRAPQGNRGPI